MIEGLAYIDGKVTDLANAKVPLTDRGFLLGDGIFETLRTTNGQPFRLGDHEARLRRGLRAINLEESLVSHFHDAVEDLVKHGTKQFGDELYIRVNVTTGPMEDVLGTGRGMSVTGVCKRFKPYPMQYYSRGIQVIVSKQRKDTRSPLSAVKTLSFLPYIAARREAHAVTAHDAILLNENDRVAEGSTSNVFALVGDRFHAPGEAEGAIPGVTRAVVLGLIEEAGLDVREPLKLTELTKATEVFLTNTTGGIVPVTRIGDALVGKGQKGELTTQLSHALEAMMRGGARRSAPARTSAPASAGRKGKPKQAPKAGAPARARAPPARKGTAATASGGRRTRA